MKEQDYIDAFDGFGMNKQERDEITQRIKDGFITEDLEPIKCTNCRSTRIKMKTKSIDGGVVSEAECYCGDCNSKLGYFAYGSWEI